MYIALCILSTHASQNTRPLKVSQSSAFSFTSLCTRRRTRLTLQVQPVNKKKEQKQDKCSLQVWTSCLTTVDTVSLFVQVAASA